MNGWRIATIALAVALVVSNALWLYASFYVAEDLRARDQMLGDRGAALAQLQKLTPALATMLSRDQVVALAVSTTDQEPFEKRGAVWVGSVGFVFDAGGKLKAVVPSWCCDDDLIDSEDVGLVDALYSAALCARIG